MSDEKEYRPGSMDEALEREIQEALGGKSLEDLLDENAPKPQRDRAEKKAGNVVAVGNVVEGRIASIDRNSVLVELGQKDQGIVPLDQFQEEPKVGDKVSLEVTRFDRTEDMWVLSRQGAVEKATWTDMQPGQIVEAMVLKVNKGGLEVQFGSVPAFMPISQVSLYRTEDASEYVGKKIRCQIVEVNRREERVIVSAKAVLELEKQEQREKLMAELQEGDVRDGIVRQVMAFGAFVDMGGVDGLVHVSQLSYSRVEDPNTVVKLGQAVKVKVLKIDAETGRISLGMKQVGPDPWTDIENKFPSGSTAEGVIVRLADFGAFCQLEPGLDGLIPISEITWTQRLKHPSEMLQTGQSVTVKVVSVDKERKRISLSIKQARANPWSGAGSRYAKGMEVEGKVTRAAEFGAFIELEPGVDGLAHISELSESERVRRVEDVLQIGQVVKVKVLEVDEPMRRISLTLKGLYQGGQELPELNVPGAEVEAAKPKKRKTPLKGGLE